MTLKTNNEYVLRELFTRDGYIDIKEAAGYSGADVNELQRELEAVGFIEESATGHYIRKLPFHTSMTVISILIIKRLRGD